MRASEAAVGVVWRPASGLPVDGAETPVNQAETISGGSQPPPPPLPKPHRRVGTSARASCSEIRRS
jgi:hypothetical protein